MPGEALLPSSTRPPLRPHAASRSDVRERSNEEGTGVVTRHSLHHCSVVDSGGDWDQRSDEQRAAPARWRRRCSQRAIASEHNRECSLGACGAAAFQAAGCPSGDRQHASHCNRSVAVGTARRGAARGCLSAGADRQHPQAAGRGVAWPVPFHSAWLPVLPIYRTALMCWDVIIVSHAPHAARHGGTVAIAASLPSQGSTAP